MDNRKQLSVRQICFFFIAFIPVTKVFLLPSVLAKYANEDMWISALINFALDIITLVALIYTSTKHDDDFYGILTKNFNETTAKIVHFTYFLYFLVRAYVPISEQKTYVELTLYETTPTFLTFFPFFAVAFYICLTKLSSIGRIADIFWWITVLGLIILFILSFPNLNVNYLLPVGANGFTNILKSSYSGTSWFGDAVFFLFFIGNFKQKPKIYLKTLVSYGVGIVLAMAFFIFFYCTFSSTSAKQIFALTEISKYSNVINDIGRFDYFSVFMILASGVFGLAMPIYFASICLQKTFSIKNRIIPAAITNVILLLVFIIFAKQYTTIEVFILSYFGLFFVLMSNVLPILTIFLRRTNEKKL